MVAQIDLLYLKTRPTKTFSRLISHSLFQGRPLTTKARWLNEPNTIFLELISQIKFKKEVVQPIFILGTGRSGTTILSKILSLHHQIGWLNEPKLLWHLACSKDDIIGNYAKQAETSFFLDEKDATSEVIAKIHRLYNSYLTLSGSTRILDKYPEMIFRLPFLNAIFPDAKFIFLVRNGWDTMHSIQKWSRENGVYNADQAEDWWGLNNRKWNLLVKQVVSKEPDLAEYLTEIKQFTQHIDMAAIEWIVTMRHGLSAMQELPDKILMIKYEDLINSPEYSMQNIFSFCNLPVDTTVANYARKVLKAVPGKSKIKINPVIDGYIAETMSLLQYSI